MLLLRPGAGGAQDGLLPLVWTGSASRWWSVMAIKFCPHVIVSDVTTHTAVRGPDGWDLSWLPGRRFSRDQATTAMVLAEALVCATDPQDWIWGHVANWMAELGITVGELPSASSLRATPEAGDR